METVKDSSNKQCKNLLAEFQSSSLETAITTETSTIDPYNPEESIAIAPGEGKKNPYRF